MMRLIKENVIIHLGDKSIAMPDLKWRPTVAVGPRTQNLHNKAITG